VQSKAVPGIFARELPCKALEKTQVGTIRPEPFDAGRDLPEVLC
jgi:hypothetical protein